MVSGLDWAGSVISESRSDRKLMWEESDVHLSACSSISLPFFPFSWAFSSKTSINTHLTTEIALRMLSLSQFSFPFNLTWIPQSN